MKTTKRVISTILVVMMCLTMAPLNGFMEIKWEGSDFPEFDFSEIFTPEAKAATSGYYTYFVTDGKAEITYVNRSISGDITIPSTLGSYPVTSIGECAFEDCEALTSVTIPDSVTSIGDSAFAYCTALTSVSIPDSVTFIGDAAFYCCSALTSVSIPDSVTSIGDGTFAYCDALTSVTIPDSVTSIGDSAFEGCSALTSVSISDSVTSIGDSAFEGCSALTSVSISDSVTSIGSYAFAFCYALTSIIVDENNSNYSSDANGVLFNKNRTTLIQYPAGSNKIAYTIPDSVTSIGRYAFFYCSALTSVTIPDSVTSIGERAFFDCSALTSVSIPDSVTYIYSHTFYRCDKLTDVYYSGTQEQWQKISIDNGNTPLLYATIHYNAYHKLEAVFSDSDTAKIKGTSVVAVTQTTVRQILSQAGSGAYISDKNGKQVAGDAYTGTGMTLTLSDGKKYTVVVLGDIDGDSKATAADARLSLRASVGLEKYDEASAQYKAANIQSDDKITAADARLILRASVGLEDAKKWMK